MTKLIALRKTYYKGNHLPGEEFEVDEKFVPILTQTGAARVKTESDEKPKAKRYNRRDLRAED